MLRNFILTAAGMALLAGCTSGNSAQVPPFTSVNVPATTKLEFAVGTANIQGTPGLNTVVSFRQSSGSNAGLSGTLVNTPTIVGPPGFLVPAVSFAGSDAGTAQISGAPQTSNSATPPPADTFTQRGGAFAYGFAPANADTTGAAFYPQFSAFRAANNAIYAGTASGTGAILNTYMEPRYVDGTTAYPYVGGPPAYPFFQDGTQQTGFIGFPSGFTVFSGANPVAGTYGLSLVIPGTSASTTSTITASGTLSSTALLPPLPAPTFVQDGAGGGTVSITIPAGITETLVYVVDAAASPNFYTLLIAGTGPQSAVLPPNLGPLKGTSIATGDPYFVYAVGVDYPAFEAAPPLNRSATPTITGTNGQADITLSPVTAVAAY